MEMENRILQLPRVKMQLLVSWLSHQELAALIRSGEQDLEDYVMDNISREGRRVLLEQLNMDVTDYEKRLVIVRRVNSRYLELLLKQEQALTTEERKDLLKSAAGELSEEDHELYNSRRRFPEAPVSETVRREIEGYLEKLDRGQSLSNSSL